MPGLVIVLRNSGRFATLSGVLFEALELLDLDLCGGEVRLLYSVTTW